MMVLKKQNKKGKITKRKIKGKETSKEQAQQQQYYQHIKGEEGMGLYQQQQGGRGEKNREREHCVALPVVVAPKWYIMLIAFSEYLCRHNVRI